MVYFFDDNQKSNRQALQLDLNNFRVMFVGPPTLPIYNSYPNSVYTGEFIYILGGHVISTGADPIYTDGIYEFDPSTFESRFIQVANLPLRRSDSIFLLAPAMVFVPHSNRIYCFGGVELTDDLPIFLDYVFFIDLTPLRDQNVSASSLIAEPL